MTVDQDMLTEEERPGQQEVPTAVLFGYATAAAAVFGWFLFGWLVQQQGFVDSVGESAGAAFALLLAVSVIGALRRNGR
ncbi:hypothetical protein [Micromonospora sp. DT31]|uniref:hypothetical protein n=1 Tax=Micromonospora sp. DT31 TaxID=3393434 RepID=UPI003CFAFF07